MTRVLVDTGPLVALLNRSRPVQLVGPRGAQPRFEPPMFTCEAVVSEACFLLRRITGGGDAVFALLSEDVLRVDFRITSEIDAVRALVKRFAGVPMAVADACLVPMTEIEPRSVVLTLDSDFTIYRRNRRQLIPAIMPK